MVIYLLLPRGSGPELVICRSGSVSQIMTSGMNSMSHGMGEYDIVAQNGNRIVLCTACMKVAANPHTSETSRETSLETEERELA